MLPSCLLTQSHESLHFSTFLLFVICAGVEDYGCFADRVGNGQGPQSFRRQCHKKHWEVLKAVLRTQQKLHKSNGCSPSCHLGFLNSFYVNCISVNVLAVFFHHNDLNNSRWRSGICGTVFLYHGQLWNKRLLAINDCE